MSLPRIVPSLVASLFTLALLGGADGGCGDADASVGDGGEGEGEGDAGEGEGEGEDAGEGEGEDAGEGEGEDGGEGEGVGVPCSAGGGECGDFSLLGGEAWVCTVDFVADAALHMCTRPCGTDGDCGSGAVCTGDPGDPNSDKGCVPDACVDP